MKIKEISNTSEKHCEYCDAPVGKPTFTNGYVYRLYKIREYNEMKMACMECLIRLKKEDRTRYIPQEYPVAI